MTAREAPSGDRWCGAALQSPHTPRVLGWGGRRGRRGLRVGFVYTGALPTCLGQPQVQNDAPSDGEGPLTPSPARHGCRYRRQTPAPVSGAGGAHRPGVRAAQRKQLGGGQIPWTETCSPSKITTGNPNGLSLAAHQTAVCEETRSGRPQPWTGSRCPVCVLGIFEFPARDSFSGNEAVFKGGKGFTDW